MKYVVGIDSGGTATKVKAYTLDQTCCFEQVVGPGNSLLFPEETIVELSYALRLVYEALGPDCEGIAIGLAGLSAANNQQEMTTRIKQAMPFTSEIPFHLYNDAQLAYLARNGVAAGILVIAGTGSVVVGYQNGQWSKIGGWGPVLGDEGSGYALSLQVYRELTKTIDRQTELNDWQRAFLEWSHQDSAQEAIRTFYQSERQEIAKVARFLGEYQDRFTYCHEVLCQAGEALADMINQWGTLNWTTSRKLNCAFNGSVVEKNPIVQQSLINHCHYPLKIATQHPSPFAAWRLFYEQEGEQS